MEGATADADSCSSPTDMLLREYPDQDHRGSALILPLRHARIDGHVGLPHSQGQAQLCEICSACGHCFTDQPVCSGSLSARARPLCVGHAEHSQPQPTETDEEKREHQLRAYRIGPRELRQ